MFPQSGTKVRDLEIRARNGMLDQTMWRWPKEELGRRKTIPMTWLFLTVFDTIFLKI